MIERNATDVKLPIFDTSSLNKTGIISINGAQRSTSQGQTSSQGHLELRCSHTNTVEGRG